MSLFTKNWLIDCLIRVITTLILVCTLLATKNVNSDLQSKDISYLAIDSFTPYKPIISPKEFCNLALRENFAKVHCTTANAFNLNGWNAEVHQKGIDELKRALASYKDLQEKIRNQSHVNSTLVEIDSSTQRKIQQLEQAISKTEHSNDAIQYQSIFTALLIAQGVSYNPYTNRFKSLPQNLAQYVMNQSFVKLQLETLVLLSKNLQYFFAILIPIFYILIRKKISSLGQLFVAFYFLLVFSGLAIVRDSSLHFGTESVLFDLNPFRQVFERQVLITCLSVGLFLLCLVGTSQLNKLTIIFAQKVSLIKSALLIIAVTLLMYFLFGPAIGSETFKLSICLISATLFYRYGRPLELAQDKFGLKKLIGQPISYALSKKNKSEKRVGIINLRAYFSSYITKKIIFQLMLIGLLIASVAILFSDLGGALISTCIFTFTLFILLGRKFGVLLLVIFFLVCGIVLIVSEKIQSRVQLMIEPMSANISDFARLIQFEQNGQPMGYRFGHIKWCSSDGVCVPLQSLSDYMPALLSAWIGKLPSLALLTFFAITLLLLAYRCFMSAWLRDSNYKFLRFLCASLCMASMFQLLVTLMGNMRVIPLTGLGTPLISIGISTSITASIGLGLAINLCFKK